MRAIGCQQCDADEFHIENGDWLCANGHLQNWTVISGHGEVPMMGPR
jgi:hypothetical protein